jgi:hypothetical protein
MVEIGRLFHADAFVRPLGIGLEPKRVEAFLLSG